MSIGSRIRQARKGANLSQRELAKRMNLSAMMISKYENEKNIPNSEILLRLSKILEVEMDYFLRKKTKNIELMAYRKHAKLGKKQQDAIRFRIQDWLDRYIEVEDLFPQEKITPSLAVFPINTLADAEIAAQKLRALWSLGIGPIENMIQLLEDKGIKVGLVSGFDGFDACTFVFDHNYVIACKSGLSGDRQRLSIAHELGHLVLGGGEALDEEKAAYRFAGAFLVPAEQAYYELGKHRNNLDMNELFLLKHKYGLSMQAWIYRAKDLCIISENTFVELNKYFRHQRWYREEPGEIYPSEKPLRMRKLVYRALSEDLITRSKAKEFLGGSAKPWMILEEQQPNEANFVVGH